jgi:hypothetical protein
MSEDLPRSLHPLAMLAAREAGAVGFAIHSFDPPDGRRRVHLEWGVAASEPVEKGFTTAAFPLRSGDDVTGVLTFVFRGACISPRAQAVSERIAAVIEEVWRLSRRPSVYARDAARAGELESALADSKIADRAHGLLANGAPSGDAVDTIARHVESVLRHSEFTALLRQFTQDIERETAERELATRAKAVLQNRYGMSEDQAHSHLRLVSRKSRKPLREVARDVLEEAPSNPIVRPPAPGIMSRGAPRSR